MTILAFDPAYALKGSKPALVWYQPTEDGFEVDWWNFRPTAKNLDARFNQILGEINAFAEVSDITAITTLAVYKTAYGRAALGLSELVGMFRGWGWMNGITDFHRIHDKTVKGAIAGNGNAKKPAMLRAVQSLWPRAPKDEPDVIDAFALAYFVANRKRG